MPKPLRDLTEGVRHRITEDGDRLVIEPIAVQSVPVEVDGLLVIRGTLRGVVDHRDLRQDRIARLTGEKR